MGGSFATAARSWRWNWRRRATISSGKKGSAMPVNNTITTFPPLAELTDARIVEVARAAGEPEWLVELRGAAWRHTDLSKFKAEQVTAPVGIQGTTIQWDAKLAAQGVIFTTLATALRDHEA